MENLKRVQNPYDEDKVREGCAIFGMMDTSGQRFCAEPVMKAITNMHDRSNGLGGGFAIYGLYPDYARYYAFHIMYLSADARAEVESFLRSNFRLLWAEEIPTRSVPSISNAPPVWRYFLDPDEGKCAGWSPDDYVREKVMQVNTLARGALVFSSGKNMGVFKGVGYPEEIGEYFRLDEYEGYIWLAHGRFPTNSPGWWGGAHPFSILNWSVVHNGELSSYGINRRYLEQCGYPCTMQTDTEVITHAVDLLTRKHGLPLDLVRRVLAPPLWSEIAHLPPEEQRLFKALRQVYPSLLLNGPFSVIIASHDKMMGLTDRIRLRPLTVGIKGPKILMSSEEAAIHLACPDPERVWIPRGGELIVGSIDEPAKVGEGRPEPSSCFSG